MTPQEHQAKINALVAKSLGLDPDEGMIALPDPETLLHKWEDAGWVYQGSARLTSGAFSAEIRHGDPTECSYVIAGGIGKTRLDALCAAVEKLEDLIN